MIPFVAWAAAEELEGRSPAPHTNPSADIAPAAQFDTRWIPWGTVTILATVDTGLSWSTGEAARPTLGGATAVLVGPAALRLRTPKRDDVALADTDILGLSAGFLARLDTPRAGTGEVLGRVYGGYVRLGRQPPGGEETRATLAAGWRQSIDDDGPMGHGQLVTTLVVERRIVPVAAVTAHLDAGFGNAETPWRVAAGAGAMVGF
jgi:hypothetical protein